MKRILFIVEGYHKHNIPNTLCVEGILSQLDEHDDIDVDILSIEQEIICMNQNKVYEVVFQTESKNRVLCLIAKIKKFFWMPVGNRKLVKALTNKIEKLLDENCYDTIIPVINPVEAAEAVYRLKRKRKKIQFILYEIDPNSNRYKTPKGVIEKIWKFRSTKWEKKIYDLADYIFHMQSHKRHFESKKYEKYTKKSAYLDIPTFEIHPLPSKTIYGKIKMLYAGAFYPKLRNPEPMIRILNEVSKVIDIDVQIYTGNMMKKELKKYEVNNSFLHIFDAVPQKEIRKFMAETDILLSLGNSDSDFLPSKTLDYIGTLKPVIHFQPDPNDVSSAYYKRYDRAKIINVNDDSCISEIVDFIEELSFDETNTFNEKLFMKNTSKYSAEKMYHIILQS